MRTSLSLEDDLAALVIECAEVQNRSVAGQLRHLIKTHPEIIGWKAFRDHPALKNLPSKAEV